MGMEDYQVNGMGYEKPVSEHRLDYLNSNSFGRDRNYSTQCPVCGHQSCNIMEVELRGCESRVVRTIHPSVFRYSEV